MAYIDPQPGLVSRSSYGNCAVAVLCIITMPRVDAATLRTTPALTFGLLSMGSRVSIVAYHPNGQGRSLSVVTIEPLG